MPRYLQASEGQTSYGIEGTAYNQASSSTTYFGLIRDEHEPPVPNPQTSMTTSGADRQPYVNSPDPIDYQWTVPYDLLDHNAPLEVAMGSRTSSTQNSGASDEYTEHLFELANRLPTMTVQHNQADTDLEAHYIGCKSNLSISFSQGDPVQLEQEIMAQSYTYDDTVSTAPDLSIPQTTPFRFHHVGDVTLSNPSDGSTIKTLATISSGDVGLDNGLEANHHSGREPYAIKETSAAGLFDTSMDFTITDLDLFKRAADAAAPVDIEIPFVRETVNSTPIDAAYIRLLECDITSAPVPRPSEGDLVPNIEVMPTGLEIEIREPA